MGQVIAFPVQPRLVQLAENLWLMRLSDTPEAYAETKRMIAQLRKTGAIVPDYMKGNEQ